MRVLSLNAGVTNLRFGIYDGDDQATEVIWGFGYKDKPVDESFAAIWPKIEPYSQDITIVAHRVFHGGRPETMPGEIDDALIETIEAAARFAPKRNRAALALIHAAKKKLPNAKHVAVFDAALFSRMSAAARFYALPFEAAKEHAWVRFGFDGMAHWSSALAAAEALQKHFGELKIITCHLDESTSVTAFDGGSIIDTSMGKTELDGLLSATAAGEIDAGIVLDMVRHYGSADEVERILTDESGLKGLSAGASDFETLSNQLFEGDSGAALALDVFRHRLVKTIGGYIALLGGLDALVFSGKIGEKTSWLRRDVADQMSFLDLRVDSEKNDACLAIRTNGAVDISGATARVKTFVFSPNDEQFLAESAAAALEEISDA